DLRARNNVAQCSLLLDMYGSQSLAIARQLAKESPKDNVILSTFAYALLVNQRTEDALREIEKIPLEQLRQSSLALYYGLILQASGNLDKAREFLILPDRKSLLPEENRLCEKALELNTATE
ncbi:MAG: hypothetical protein ABIZ56_05650, partial [Chthoniobacteraceae bacterium]